MTTRADRLRDEMLEGISEKDIEVTLRVFGTILENAQKQR
jgi:MarR family transcriptional regulator for hemolysin